MIFLLFPYSSCLCIYNLTKLSDCLCQRSWRYVVTYINSDMSTHRVIWFFLSVIIENCKNWAYNFRFYYHSNWWLLNNSWVHLLRIIYLVSGLVMGHGAESDNAEMSGNWMHQNFVLRACLKTKIMKHSKLKC